MHSKTTYKDAILWERLWCHKVNTKYETREVVLWDGVLHGGRQLKTVEYDVCKSDALEEIRLTEVAWWWQVKWALVKVLLSTARSGVGLLTVEEGERRRRQGKELAQSHWRWKKLKLLKTAWGTRRGQKRSLVLVSSSLCVQKLKSQCMRKEEGCAQLENKRLLNLPAKRRSPEITPAAVNGREPCQAGAGAGGRHVSQSN